MEVFTINGYQIIKDLFIHEDKLYVAYVAEIAANCFGIEILVADVNFKKLDFENFFTSEDCGTLSHEIGGRTVFYKNNKLLLTLGHNTGDAQDKNNLSGKLIAIDIQTKEYEIISMGHRNPQGLFYDSKNNVIFSTEHGPDGGDEVNLNLSPQGEVENYGWPIASYGVPYRFDAKKDKDPYKKSHKDYGFIEPLKDFTPSIGISQVIEIDKKFNGIDDKQLFVGAMGFQYGRKQGSQSLHYFLLDNDYTMSAHHVQPINKRIRDIIYIEDINKMLLSFDVPMTIGILEAKTQ